MKKLFVTTVLCVCANVFAQQSPLGLRYPLGVPENAVTGASAAMGGVGVAVAEETFAAARNIANAGIGDRASFSALVSFDLTQITDGDDEATIHGYTPTLLSLIIPIGAAGNIAVAMQKQYNANLNFYTQGEWTSFEDIDAVSSHRSTIELHRRGGLTAWQVGWAKRFNNGFAVGFGYERLFGSVDSRNVFVSETRYENLTNINDTTPETAGTRAQTFRRTVEEMRVANFASDALRFGLQVPVHDRVTLGVAASYVLPPGNDNGTYERETRHSDNLVIDTLPLTDGSPNRRQTDFSINLPPTLSVGVSYKPNDRLLLAADVHTEFWEFWDATGGGFEIYNDALRNTYGVSFGIRYIPAGSSHSARYSEKIHYSAGLNYAALPTTSNEGAHEYALTLGVGLPIPNDGGLIDIVVSAGQRVDGRFSNYAENVIKFQLGINGGRRWFQQGER